MFILTMASDWEFCFLIDVAKRVRCWKHKPKVGNGLFTYFLNIWETLYIVLFYCVSCQDRQSSCFFLSKAKSSKSFYIDGYQGISGKNDWALVFLLFLFVVLEGKIWYFEPKYAFFFFLENTCTLIHNNVGIVIILK